MNKVQDIQIEDYNYNLPDHLIARFPLEKRDDSRLLVYREGDISEDLFNHLDSYLPDQCLMVFNNTRVIQARLAFRKESGASIEIFCLEPKEPADYALAFQQKGSCTWLCMVGNARKWKTGKIRFEIPAHAANTAITVTAERLQTSGDTSLIRFEWDHQEMTFSDILETSGELPIPPYLNRKTEEKDKTTYQTIYSRIKGSVAAPTAGLHFTPEVFEKLKKKQIVREEVTLHVGAGTFKPVKTPTIGSHEMHTEMISVQRHTIEQLLHHQGEICAVGTTSVRTLESLYYIGVQLGQHPNASDIYVSQWEPYQAENNTLSAEQALTNILSYLDRSQSDQLMAHTSIMIVPGYVFRIVNVIITNFHQPQSTLLLLISAFIGEDWKSIYNYALIHDFRFLSYGDSSVLLPGCKRF